jgi:catechol 2,3-dioxygenase-like lactoylglutathione lyase family enzyme
MAFVDHLGITVEDLTHAMAQWDPVMAALGYEKDADGGSVGYDRGDDTQIILFPAREAGRGPHRHGRVGWQHLAFTVESRAEVDRLHAVALAAGWTAVRDPKPYPRFSRQYYATFLEDADGIRLEFMHQAPEEPRAD